MLDIECIKITCCPSLVMKVSFIQFSLWVLPMLDTEDESNCVDIIQGVAGLLDKSDNPRSRRNLFPVFPGPIKVTKIASLKGWNWRWSQRVAGLGSCYWKWGSDWEHQRPTGTEMKPRCNSDLPPPSPLWSINCFLTIITRLMVLPWRHWWECSPVFPDKYLIYGRQKIWKSESRSEGAEHNTNLSWPAFWEISIYGSNVW